jgi:hypothetical protein
MGFNLITMIIREMWYHIYYILPYQSELLTKASKYQLETMSQKRIRGITEMHINTECIIVNNQRFLLFCDCNNKRK